MKKLCGSSHQNVDIISHLPDPIRCHIVSSLPLIDAVRTQILSKGWRHVWPSISNFDFSQYYFQEINREVHVFRDFVDERLHLHDGSDVLKFDLAIKVDDALISARHVNSWISFALRHNVQDFHLHLMHSSGKLEQLPCHFFTCNTLKVLSLYSMHDLKWPSMISFPRLKSFNLNNVTFYDENIANKHFSACVFPILENLSIYYCHFDASIHTLSISISCLKFLQLLNDKDLIVNLSLPTLQNIDYDCAQPPNFSSENLSSLGSAYFNFLSEHFHSNNSTRVPAILKKVYNVETLDLGYGVVKSFAGDRDSSQYLPPSFINLKHLELVLFATKNHVQILAAFLRRCPNLQTLHRDVSQDWTSPCVIDVEEKCEMNELLDGVILKHLRTIKVEDFGGREIELDMVRYLLENASILEKVDICYSYNNIGDIENQMRISQKLLSFSRVSFHAEVSVS